MRWLIDENVRRDIAIFLKDRGDNVAFVESGITDGEVLRSAKRQRRILLTCDKDFAHPLTHPSASSHGIVVLCVHPPRFETCIEVLMIFFSRNLLVKGKTVILMKDRLEIR